MGSPPRRVSSWPYKGRQALFCVPSSPAPLLGALHFLSHSASCENPSRPVRGQDGWAFAGGGDLGCRGQAEGCPPKGGPTGCFLGEVLGGYKRGRALSKALGGSPVLNLGWQQGWEPGLGAVQGCDSSPISSAMLCHVLGKTPNCTKTVPGWARIQPLPGRPCSVSRQGGVGTSEGLATWVTSTATVPRQRSCHLPRVPAVETGPG